MLTDDELGKQLEGLNKRLDTLTVEVVELKSEFRSHGELLRAMQETQQELVKVVLQLHGSMGDLNRRVDRLESGQERLIVLVGRIVDRLTDFEAGGRVELDNVDYDKDARTLKGTIRRITK